MGKLFDEHEGWTREDLDEMFGPHPDHASAPSRAELQAELDAEIDATLAELDDESEEESTPFGWTDLSDDGIKAAVRTIVRTSTSDEEIRQRIADELAYPYGDVAITSHLPTDDVGREAQAIVKGLGGLIRSDGGMVMIMLHGLRGNTISV